MNPVDKFFACPECGKIKCEFKGFALIYAYAWGCGLITAELTGAIGYFFYGDGIMAVVQLACVYGTAAFLIWALILDKKLRCQCPNPSYLSKAHPVAKEATCGN